ncbi:hypothetical protein [Kitasatospora sp. NPDC094015]|uniref:hypothetical protein n=1 Tax=Kitasatospora sp. NPDC094015 TaxID=3155205 RepID=UPI0033208CED
MDATIGGGTFHGQVVQVGELNLRLSALFTRLPRPVSWLLAAVLLVGAAGGVKLLAATGGGGRGGDGSTARPSASGPAPSAPATGAAPAPAPGAGGTTPAAGPGSAPAGGGDPSGAPPLPPCCAVPGRTPAATAGTAPGPQPGQDAEGSTRPAVSAAPSPTPVPAGEWSGGFHTALQQNGTIDLGNPDPQPDTTDWSPYTTFGWYGKGQDGHEQVAFKGQSAAFLPAGQPATHAACLGQGRFSPTSGFAPQGFDPGTRVCVFSGRSDALMTITGNTAGRGTGDAGVLTFDVLYLAKS